MKTLAECSVLVVDDTEANVDILVEALGETYEVSVAMDGPSALEAVMEAPPDLILLDIMMPEMDGYEVCRRLKADRTTAGIPVIFLTALTEIENKTRGFTLGAVDYITKPFEVLEVQSRVGTHLSLKLAREEQERQNEILEERVRERTLELALTQEVTIEGLAALAEYRDPETGGHIRRTKNYVRALALRLRNHPRFRDFLDEETIDLLYKSAPLHDIGKVGIPDHILLKEGKLTAEEFEEIKKHTIYGHNANSVAERKLGSNSFLRIAAEIAYSHQEKWDGSGYPRGLRGEAIPVSGRLMALADVYDALISRRTYKPSLPHDKAVEIIFEGRGRHFDPDVVDAFMELQDEFRQIARRFADIE
jgi:putative two-component system response regulator